MKFKNRQTSDRGPNKSYYTGGLWSGKGHEGHVQGARNVLCLGLSGGITGVNIYNSSSCPLKVRVCFWMPVISQWIWWMKKREASHCPLPFLTTALGGKTCAQSMKGFAQGICWSTPQPRECACPATALQEISEGFKTSVNRENVLSSWGSL